MNKYRIAAVGEGTARALNENNISPDFVPTEGTMTALAEQMCAKYPMSGATVVRVRGNYRDDAVEKILSDAGAKIISLPVYRTFHTRWLAANKDKLFAYPPDVVLFTSGPGVDGLVENLDERQLKTLASGALLVSIGPSTSKVIRKNGLTVGLEPKSSTLPSVIEELITYFKTHPLPRSE